MDLTQTISIIMLNINGINIPITRQILSPDNLLTKILPTMLTIKNMYNTQLSSMETPMKIIQNYEKKTDTVKLHKNTRDN